MQSIVVIARRAADRFKAFRRPTLVCSACGRRPRADEKLIAGPRVYLCSTCFERAARTLAPRRLPADAERCRFCRTQRAASEITRVESVTVCADCLGLIEACLNETETVS